MAFLHVTFIHLGQLWEPIRASCSVEEGCDHSLQRGICHVERKQLRMIPGRCQLLVPHLEKQLPHKHPSKLAIEPLLCAPETSLVTTGNAGLYNSHDTTTLKIPCLGTSDFYVPAAQDHLLKGAKIAHIPEGGQQ